MTLPRKSCALIPIKASRCYDQLRSTNGLAFVVSGAASGFEIQLDAACTYFREDSKCNLKLRRLMLHQDSSCSAICVTCVVSDVQGRWSQQGTLHTLQDAISQREAPSATAAFVGICLHTWVSCGFHGGRLHVQSFSTIIADIAFIATSCPADMAAGRPGAVSQQTQHCLALGGCVR